MPEAFAIFALFAVIAAAFIGARKHADSSAGFNSPREIERLKHHELWLQQRLERARRENWGDDMIAGFAKELATTSHRLSESSGRNYSDPI